MTNNSLISHLIKYLENTDATNRKYLADLYLNLVRNSDFKALLIDELNQRNSIKRRLRNLAHNPSSLFISDLKLSLRETGVIESPKRIYNVIKELIE